MIILVFAAALILVTWIVVSRFQSGILDKIQTIAGVMETESFFRGYWRTYFKEVTGKALSPHDEDRIVSSYMPRHREFAALVKTITASNSSVVMSVVEKQNDELDDAIFSSFGHEESTKWRRLGKRTREKMQKRILRGIGVKLF